EDLQTQLRDERSVRSALRAYLSTRDDKFMRALRLDLLMTDLALKREIMRFGALRTLSDTSRDSRGPLSETELLDAKRALLCERPELTWEGLLDETSVPDSVATRIVTLVASARRVGVPLLHRMESTPAENGGGVAHASSLPLATYVKDGPKRSIADVDAA